MLEAEEEEQQQQPKQKARQEDPAELAIVLDLDADFEDGEGAGAWRQALGGAAATPANLAARADIAVILSADRKLQLQTIKDCLEACKKAKARRPFIFAGPFLPEGDLRDIDRLSGLADGLIVRSEPQEEEAIEAELLRRSSSSLAEALLIDRSTWSQAPAICLTGQPEVLFLVSQSAVEWCLLLEEPPERMVPPGRLMICSMPEHRPWWAGHCGVSGPKLLTWYPWVRDPRIGWTK